MFRLMQRCGNSGVGDVVKRNMDVELDVLRLCGNMVREEIN